MDLMVKRPDLPVKDVGIHVGFADQHYFSRLFKKLIGVPPSEFRKNGFSHVL